MLVDNYSKVVDTKMAPVKRCHMVIAISYLVSVRSRIDLLASCHDTLYSNDRENLSSDDLVVVVFFVMFLY